MLFCMSVTGESLRVLIADDHRLFREGLRGVLEADGLEVVGEATDGHGALALARGICPDVVVLDLRMPGLSGLEVLRELTASCPEVQTVMLTASDSNADVLAALAGGACGYLLKDTRADRLADSIRQAADGQMVLSKNVARALIEHVRLAADPGVSVSGRGEATNPAAGAGADSGPRTEERPALSPREMQVLGLIVEGADNAAIGLELSLSPHTVKQYVTNILEKLGVRSRVQAAVYAVRAGLV
jgi:DNA-binding NarL/FixJ family response regulator